MTRGQYLAELLETEVRRHAFLDLEIDELIYLDDFIAADVDVEGDMDFDSDDRDEFPGGW